MKLVVHNHLAGANATGRAAFAKTLRTGDASFTDSDAWYKAVFAKYPKAKIHEERLASGGFAKVAYVENKVVGKYSFAERKSGWVVDAALDAYQNLVGSTQSYRGVRLQERKFDGRIAVLSVYGKELKTPRFDSGSEAKAWVDNNVTSGVKALGDRKRAKDKPYVGDDGKVHTFINDDPKQGPCGCGHYRGVDAKPDEYLARVDAHLKTLDPAAKKKFLQKQRVDFEQRYTDFRNRAERNSNNIGPNETAEAYVQTITGLGQRLGSL